MSSSLLRLYIDSLSAEGRGVGRVDGKTVFVEGALPGEVVNARYLRRQRRYDEAILVEVLEPSPDRVSAHCVHFGVCGGCSLQHLSSAAQIKAKEQIMLDALARIGAVKPSQVLPPIVSDVIWGYRRKARLSVKYVQAKGGVLVGFRERRSNYLAELHSCPVLHPAIGERITALKELLTSLSVREYIPQIELAVGDDNHPTLIMRVLQMPCKTDCETLTAFAKAHKLSLWLQPKGPDSVIPLWPPTLETLCYAHPDFDVRITFTPLDFIQAHAAINRLLVKQAIALLDVSPENRVLDLFCGLGNFTLPLASIAHEVIGMEGERQMVSRAQENASAHHFSNVHYQHADLITPTSDSFKTAGNVDRILLDPPRAGAQAIIAQIAATHAKRIVYVSCNPATLARDAGMLVHTYGYQLEAAGAIDMFPHTAHAESIAVFAHNKV